MWLVSIQAIFTRLNQRIGALQFQNEGGIMVQSYGAIQWCKRIVP